MRIAAVVNYDGQRFHGWQSQPGLRTVQDQLEQALAMIAGEPVRVVCAGRTDTGVHARAQVIHFDTDAARPTSAWVRGVNAHLPDDVAVSTAQRVRDDFHARYSASARRYMYLLLQSPARSALWHARAGWTHLQLDTDAMRAAGASLIGEHDFTSFRSSQCQAKHPVRTLSELSIEAHGPLLVLRCRANGFLHHMVRNIVGALVAVGAGRQPPAWISELMAARDRRQAAPTYSAAGLYLTGVDYPSEFGIAMPASHGLPALD